MFVAVLPSRYKSLGNVLILSNAVKIKHEPRLLFYAAVLFHLLGSLSASVLPITTCILFAVPHFLPQPIAFGLAIAVALGWMFVCCCFCIPLSAAVDEVH